jgi:thiosulfate dehydrogenase (quinone) large subunit
VSILPLRLFLGITFVYAGIQKLQDPGFFKAGAPTYIGNQLRAYSRGSPIAFLLHRMMAQAVLIGGLTVITEMSIGILVLLGLFTRPAALIGLVLSFTFFLSASWNTYPYFFGSDIVFVVCWLTLALTGPGALSLDALPRERALQILRGRFGSPRAALALRLLGGPFGRSLAAPAEESPDFEHHEALLTRAEALVAAGVALLLVVLGLHSRTGAGSAGTTLAGPSNAGSSNKATQNNGTGGTQPGTAPTPTAGSVPAAPAGFKRIGNVSQLPANSAGTVSDAKTGDPVVVVHTSAKDFFAYDAICTHAGCTVQYDPSSKMLVCPCHGGTFDPAHGAQVVSGPPPSPLSPINMKIDSKGNIYIA